MLRYSPGAGWVREFLLSSSGAVSKPLLRGVAWPEPGRAHAVGDLGAMWMWRAETGLWERDPATPVGFEGNLMGVAFAPATRCAASPSARRASCCATTRPGRRSRCPRASPTANFTSVAFAGHAALVAAGSDLLVEDGAGWRVDAGRERCSGRAPRRASSSSPACPTAGRSPPARTS